VLRRIKTFVLSGQKGIGKSTICQRIVELAFLERIACGGIITYKSGDGSIIIKDLQSEKTEFFAGVEDKYSGPHLGKYYFSPNGIQFGIEAIKRGLAADILFVDELGPLELSKKGFYSIMDLLFSEKTKTSIVVIREELLPFFLPLAGTRPLIFTATAANRDELPGMIFSQIISGKPIERANRDRA
jgi:nucleoside-triphosphatase